MKNIIKKSINAVFILGLIVSFTIILPQSMYCQNTLSNADLELFKTQAHQKVRSFEHCIRQIMNDVNSRQAFIERALNLFKPNATIEVAGKKSGNRTIPIVSYLNSTVPKYAQNNKIVVINFIAVKIGEWSSKTNNKGKVYYEAPITFSQRFCWRKKSADFDVSNFDYCDLTVKESTVTIEEKVGIKGNYWQLLLGNIEVNSITD
jgi:hypothetical protein